VFSGVAKVITDYNLEKREKVNHAIRAELNHEKMEMESEF